MAMWQLCSFVDHFTHDLSVLLVVEGEVWVYIVSVFWNRSVIIVT